MSAEDWACLRRLAQAAGAEETLAPVLTGQPADLAAASGYERELQDWRIQVAMPGAKSVPAIVELTRLPVRRWPRAIWHSLVLTEAEIREKQPLARPGRWGLLVARLRRVGWGLRGTPSAIVLVWRERTRPGRSSS